MDVLGVILAGGFNRRMGAPKHALRARDGRSFAELVRAAVAPVVDDRLLVVGPDEVLPDLPHALDEPRGRGPLAGIDAAFTALPTVAPRATDLLIVPCDAPRLTSDLLRRLLVPTDRLATAFSQPIPNPEDEDRKIGDSSHFHLPLKSGGRSERKKMGTVPIFPLPSRVARSAALRVRARIEQSQFAVHELLEELTPLVIQLDAPDIPLLANINTPEEYDAYLADELQ